MNFQKQKADDGFTLIELLIVIGIIAILVGMVVIAIGPAELLAGARNNQREAHVNAIYGSAEQYFFTNNALPGCISTYESDAKGCESDLTPTYLNDIPRDPVCGDDTESGYLVKEDAATGNIGVKAPCTEDGPPIIVGVWGEYEGTYFSIDITGTNSPIMEGEILDVDVIVTNIGDESGTENVALSVGGQEKDSKNITLDPGDSASTTFSWNTEQGDYGSHTITVAGENHSSSTTVFVDESVEFFQIDAFSTNAPITEGDVLEVTVDVVNIGDESGTQDIALMVEGTEKDSKSVTLEVEASTTETLTWNTQEGDMGEYTVVAVTDNDQASTSVTVEEDVGEFLVTITGTNSPIVAGDVLEVYVTIENTGEDADTQIIEMFNVSAVQVDTSEESLMGGGTKNITLEWDTTSDDDGDNTMYVYSDDDSATAGVTIEPVFNVNITSTNSPVTEGDTLNVTADITNTGDIIGTRDITLIVDGVDRDTKTVSLSGGSSSSETFSWTTAKGDVGDYSAIVASKHESDSVNVEIQYSCELYNVGEECGGGIVAGPGLIAYYGDEGDYSWGDAMTVCDTKTSGGFEDWILPDENELDTLYDNRDTIGGFTNSIYWSSTEFLTTGWGVFKYFCMGGEYTPGDDGVYRVRCVRTF